MTQGLSVSTICSPSRYNFMTGRYYNHCYNEEFLSLYPKGKASCVTNNIGLENDGMNIGGILKRNGYRTGFIGKFHLSDHGIIHTDKHWEEHGLKTYPKESDPKNEVVSQKMKHNHNWWAKRISEFGFDYVNGVYAANMRELFNDKSNVHHVEWTVDKAFEFLDRQKKRINLSFSCSLQQ